jgi:antitoxin (DNA-binding transcriptional repressor) of toxin-antitoxin stability system
MQLSSKDLRFHTKAALDAVKRGEQIDITFHGKVVAVMVAPEAIEKTVKTNNVEDVAGFGMWTDRKGVADIDAYVRDLRKPRYKL